MYSYCSIIQKCMQPHSALLLNDESFHKKNIHELIYYIHKTLLHTNGTTNSNNVYTEINQSNLYYLLTKMIIAYKNKASLQEFITEKYNYLSSIVENLFLNNTNLELFFTDFSKIQKTYFSLSKFARLWKYKRSPVKVNTDLYINELNEEMKNVFVLYEDGAKYFFSATDLVNIMNSSLCHTYMFFSEPLKPRNPYNNLPFNKSTLYNIYFFMRRCGFIMPQLFEQYFMCDFDIKLFKSENECLIRSFSIKRYINSSNYELLHDSVLEMINYLKRRNKKYKHFMNIDEGFPQKKLVDIMRPYLHLYYLFRYYVTGTEIKHESMHKLLTKFDLFVRFNPHFGRKIIKIEKIPNRKVTIEYNDKHMNFYKEYPKSAFPKLPVVREIGNIYTYNDNSNDYSNSSFAQLSGVREIRSIYEEINTETEDTRSSSSEEEEEEEEQEDNNILVSDIEEGNELEEDTTDGSDSVS